MKRILILLFFMLSFTASDSIIEIRRAQYVYWERVYTYSHIVTEQHEYLVAYPTKFRVDMPIEVTSIQRQSCMWTGKVTVCRFVTDWYLTSGKYSEPLKDTLK